MHFKELLHHDIKTKQINLLRLDQWYRASIDLVSFFDHFQYFHKPGKKVWLDCKKTSYLPSSHSGGELPGNHNGLSGGSGSQILDTPFVAFKRTLPGNNVVSVRGKCFDISLCPNRKMLLNRNFEPMKAKPNALKPEKKIKRKRNLVGRLENAIEAIARAIADRGSTEQRVALPQSSPPVGLSTWEDEMIRYKENGRANHCWSLHVNWIWGMAWE